MTKESLSFTFKGERKYVQGPDIIDAVIPLVINNFGNEVKQLRYVAHKMLYTNADVFFDEVPHSNLNSLLQFNHENRILYASIVENRVPIKRSVEFDEKEIQNLCIIGEGQIRMEGRVDTKFSLSEVIVSMNKFFLQNNREAKGKWIVTKIEYDSIDLINEYMNAEKLTLILLKNLNNKLTKSAICFDTKKIGHVYFSLIEQ